MWLGSLSVDCFTVSSAPVGLIGAGKIESLKVSVAVSPGLEEVTTWSDTLEHTESYIALKSTGLFFGPAGHDEGG